MTPPEVRRSLALWCPDWSLLATRTGHGLDPDVALALLEKGRVVARSAAADAEGVTVGLRMREAQARCPGITLLPHDPLRDARAFEPVVRAVDEVIPGVDVRRPGLVAVHVAGAARYYGGEQVAARALADQVRGVAGLVDVRIGIADGIHAAELAAQATTAAVPLRVVPTGASAAFLAALPLDVLANLPGAGPELVTLLKRLGLTTLGDFAALPGSSVRARFGVPGMQAHDLARGREVAPVRAAAAPPDLTRHVVFEPGLERVDQVAFGCRTMAEEFIATLTARQLVCSQVQVSVFTDDDDTGRAHSDQVWTHPRHFSSTEVVDRIRWQLQGAAASALTAPTTRHGAVVRVEVAPLALDDAAAHAGGLWRDGPADRIHHTATRLQGRLGHDGVLTAAIGGGRLLAERTQLRPWGEAAPTAAARKADQPWPGSLPGLAPTLVYDEPVPVRLLDAARALVRIGSRGDLSSDPVWLDPGPLGDGLRRVTAWAGPWPIRQRWWDPSETRRVDRVQLVDDHDQAWLLLYEQLSPDEAEPWSVEGRYD
ncbi:DNA polymerase Y family protein [Nocardioides jiangxiensis]|uniref:DNA polymerase Y family protein n=1 Tax=Nocardioides jiangxiensis TaxID=3064524 RepID=A0ABT9AY26_9ACTN|nr:DNA polymerase Y family protein [Nocardioides sp. WY-20]MDO7867218.1 DNA polymerase Y family protein [Nocardioides sp. WY-20]